MIGKVQQDSFQSLRIRIDAADVNGVEFDPIRIPSPPSLFGDSLGSCCSCSSSASSSPRECQHGSGVRGYQASPLSPLHSASSTSSSSSQNASNSSRYKTEMCRPFQENGVCKYGEKCQFAHGQQELRTVNRHPKYKTDMCRTYHSVGFCPYGPRCHFIHSLDELRPAPPTTPEKKGCCGANGSGSGNGNGNVVKQLPMFGGSTGGSSSTWNFPDNFSSDMRSAVSQLNNYFNCNNGNNGDRIGFNSSGDSSRSGSFCSDIDSLSSAASSPPPYSPAASDNMSSTSRLPIFSRLA